MTRHEILDIARSVGLNVEVANIGDGMFVGLSNPKAFEDFCNRLEQYVKLCVVLNKDENN